MSKYCAHRSLYWSITRTRRMNRQVISPDYLEKLKAHRERTGYSTMALLRDRKDIPKGLNSAIISSWLTERVKTAKPEHCAYVLQCYETLSDMEKTQRKARRRAHQRLHSKDYIPVVAAEDYFVIDDETLRELKKYHQIKLLPSRVFRTRPPDPMNPEPIIVSQLIRGRTKNATQHDLNFVLDLCRGVYAEISKPPVKIGDDILGEMEDHIERTWVSAKELFKNAQYMPFQLRSNMIQAWISKDMDHALEYHLHRVIERWRSLPDQKKGIVFDIPPLPLAQRQYYSVRRLNAPRTRPRKKRVPIQESFLNELKAQRLRTGVASVALLSRREDVPRGLNPAIINTWLMKNARSAYPSYMRYVLKVYKTLPDCDIARNQARFDNYNRKNPLPRVPIDRALLLQHKKRTGLGAVRLLKKQQDIPMGLSPYMVSGWLAGNTKTAIERYYNYVLTLYKSLPEKRLRPKKQKLKASTVLYRQDRTVITPEILRELHRYRQLKLLPREIFRTIPFDPANPNPSMVSQWIQGKTKSVHKKDLAMVLKLSRKILAEISKPKVKISDDIRTEILGHMKRTNVSSQNLLEKADMVPFGLHPNTIQSWIKGKGAFDSALPYHLDYVLDRWRSLPSGEILSTEEWLPEPISEQSSKWAEVIQNKKLEQVEKQTDGNASPPQTTAAKLVTLSKAMREELITHQERTDIYPEELIAINPDIPIHKVALKKWLSEKVQKLDKQHYDYVLSAWQKIPTPTFTLIDREFVHAHKDKFNDIKDAPDKPIGLSNKLIDSWISGRRKTARQVHWDFVLLQIESENK